MGEDADRIAARQVSDLRSAARWFRSGLPGVDVELFYARVAEGRVTFLRVDER
jgi:hypothetical protein